MFDKEDFRLWLIDRFEPEELLLYVDISTEDLLDAFPEQWEDNEALLKLYGHSLSDDEGDDAEDN